MASAWDNRKYTDVEVEKAKYVAEKLAKLLDGKPFSAIFDGVMGTMFAWAHAHGHPPKDVIERLEWLMKHDSPDGRTTEELLKAFEKGKAS